MPQPPRARTALGILASLLLAGCGFGDLFRAPGPAPDVLFVWRSDTVFAVGTMVPVRVSVVVRGDTLRDPRVDVRSLDTTRIRLNAAGDSLVGVRQGMTDIAIQLLSSMITGTPLDTLLRVRVRP